MAAVIQQEQTPRQRALVVDDSRIARYVLSGLLKGRGFEVETADSAEAALGKLAGDRPDIVFMDHLLPGMQGLEAVQRLRQQPATADLPIVMYTAQDGDVFASAARAAGADDIFVKTADCAALEDILQRLKLGAGSPDTGPAATNVYPLRPEHRSDRGSEQSGSGRGALLHEGLLESILERHREEIRADLLAEFTIMEGYEERMRRELVSRIDNMTKRALACIHRSMCEQQRVAEQRAASRRRACLLAAAVVLTLTAVLAAGLLA